MAETHGVEIKIHTYVKGRWHASVEAHPTGLHTAAELREIALELTRTAETIEKLEERARAATPLPSTPSSH